MKGWHTLLPIIFIIWGVGIALAVADQYAKAGDPPPSEPVLSIEEILDQRIQELNGNPETNRVCGRYLSRTVGMKQSWGIVCIDNRMETYMTGSGLFEMSDRHYEEHVSPVVSGLRREYINKYGWE